MYSSVTAAYNSLMVERHFRAAYLRQKYLYVEKDNKYLEELVNLIILDPEETIVTDKSFFVDNETLVSLDFLMKATDFFTNPDFKDLQDKVNKKIEILNKLGYDLTINPKR